MNSFVSLSFFLSLVMFCSFGEVRSKNMNVGGIPYTISNPSPSGGYSTEFTDEYFEVYTPIQTRYSQVFWTRNPDVPLPENIVQRFKNKVIAITGYEADQVIKTPQGDQSFPIYYAYNHHYFGWLLSSDSKMVKFNDYQPPHHLTKWAPVDTKPNLHGYPTNIVFKENPGGEYRKSYHGYPSGYAQLLYSPTTFVSEPMQIDTHNREYKGPGYKPWFWPSSIQNSTDPNSPLDPLIECPCTDRIGRHVLNLTTILTSGVCSKPVLSAVDCVAQARSLVTVSSYNTVKNMSMPSGCILVPDSADGNSFNVIFNLAASNQVCGPSDALVRSMIGRSSSLVDLVLDISGDTHNVTITMTGPDGIWFGVGFNAGSMSDLPYAIIVNGDGSVSERKLDNHAPGTVLQPSIAVLSTGVANGKRKVTMTRQISGLTSNHYTFPSSPATINFINAIGSTPTISYHKQRTASSITLIPTQVPACLCAAAPTAFLSYMNSTYSEYDVYCAPEPRGDMAHQNNPACHMETYHGGLHCCHHEWFLTDTGQDAFIPPDVDTYYLKFRFYFQEYSPASGNKAASHQHLHHWVFLIDSEVNDYEESQCAPGTMCEASITARLTAKDMGLEDIPGQYTGIMPLVMTPHCHAPSCIREELWNVDTGDLICRVTASYGTGIEPFNEAGYIALHPCLFGYQQGLRTPLVLKPETNLLAVKVFNNTFRHLGQMAQWTGLMVYLSQQQPSDSHIAPPERVISHIDDRKR